MTKSFSGVPRSDITLQSPAMWTDIQRTLRIAAAFINRSMYGRATVLERLQAAPLQLCSPRDLLQVWLKLMQTCLREHPQGGLLAIDLQNDDNEARLEVRLRYDWTGIPVHAATRCFSQVDFAINEERTLWFCQKVIEAHQGRLLVLQNKTFIEFKVYLPSQTR